MKSILPIALRGPRYDLPRVLTECGVWSLHYAMIDSMNRPALSQRRVVCHQNLVRIKVY